MAQYCRYCTYFCTGNGNYCSEKSTFPSDEAAKRTNKCKSFDLCATDAFCENDKGYMPRKKAKQGDIKDTYQQISFIQ